MKVDMTNKNSFGGFLGKDRITNVEIVGAGVNIQHEKTYYPILNESRESIQSAIRQNSTVIAHNTNINGWGTHINKTTITEGNVLNFTDEEYKAYRYFKSSPEKSKKVEKALLENGLEEYINKGLGAKLRKVVSKFMK